MHRRTVEPPFWSAAFNLLINTSLEWLLKEPKDSDFVVVVDEMKRRWLSWLCEMSSILIWWQNIDVECTEHIR